MTAPYSALTWVVPPRPPLKSKWTVYDMGAHIDVMVTVPPKAEQRDETKVSSPPENSWPSDMRLSTESSVEPYTAAE